MSIILQKFSGFQFFLENLINYLQKNTTDKKVLLEVLFITELFKAYLKLIQLN